MPKFVVAMLTFNELSYDLLPHTPYSSDLAHSRYFVFSNLKTWFGENRSGTNDAITLTNAYFEDKVYIWKVSKIGKPLDKFYENQRKLRQEMKIYFAKLLYHSKSLRPRSR